MTADLAPAPDAASLASLAVTQHLYCDACWPRDGRYVALCGARPLGVRIPDAVPCQDCVVALDSREGCTGRCGLTKLEDNRG